VFCAVWSGDPDRHALLRGHIETMSRQSVPVNLVYVFDDGDEPPPWIVGTAVVSTEPLTIYQAWNVGVQHADTEYVMNLNLDDRLAPDAVETLQDFADANHAGLVGGDWHVRYSQADTDDVKETFRASVLAFDPAWPPAVGSSVRLGSGTGERGTYGPATLWRRELHQQAPYPWQFASGRPIRIVGDLAWWTILQRHLGVPLVRVPLVIGNYHSHPAGQAEFRSEDEHHLLSAEGVQMGWYPLAAITNLKETR
jgi:hypothetical protein